MIEPLANDYYLHNFQFLIDWIRENYSDLLTPEEQRFIATFNELEVDSQCLLVRLISRKGPRFRIDKLQYTEIPDINRAVASLLDANLLHINPSLDIFSCAQILTKAELIAVFNAELASERLSRKEILIGLLVAVYPDERSWTEWTNNQFGKLLQVDLTPLVDKFLLLFFGNPYQNLSEFVLQDLGFLRYEKYDLDVTHRLFGSREDITQYQLIINLRNEFDGASTPDELKIIANALPGRFSDPKMERRRARLCNQLAYAFERLNEHALAFDLYSQHDHPPARERRIRLLEKRGDYIQAWNLLKELLASPVNEEERQIGERMAPRLAKKAGEKFSKNPAIKISEITLSLKPPANEPCDFICVEERVREFYATEAAPCFFLENQLFTSLLGLWLWPEMFRSVAGAFANPFQIAPLDMYQEDFQRRRPGISTLWELLNSGTHSAHLHAHWQEKYGIANPLVSWAALDSDILSLAIDCIPAAHLKVIFERLLFDLKNNRSGFPDLIQFFPERKEYRLIEVKGPGDRLQDNQRRWLNFFSQHSIPAEVCYVSWQIE
jgi:hypothetical protein